MKAAKIRTNALLKIDASNTVKGILADKFGKQLSTIQRWVIENDVMLTTIDALKIYEAELGITLEEAIEY